MIRTPILCAATALCVLAVEPTAQTSRPSRASNQGQTTTHASPKRPKADKASLHEARKFRRLEVAGDEVEKNVSEVVRRLHWPCGLSSWRQNPHLLWKH